MLLCLLDDFHDFADYDFLICADKQNVENYLLAGNKRVPGSDMALTAAIVLPKILIIDSPGFSGGENI